MGSPLHDDLVPGVVKALEHEPTRKALLEMIGDGFAIEQAAVGGGPVDREGCGAYGRRAQWQPRTT